MRAVAYTRVSTDEQAKNGVSLECQRAKIEAYARLKNWDLVDVVVDDGVSAKNLKRPGLQRVLALVKAGEVDTVIVAKLDRLSRSVKDIYTLVELLGKQDVALVSLSESLDATTAMGKAMIGLLAVMSELERGLIGERTKEALARLKAEGKAYSRERVEDPDIIARIKREHREGSTLRAITERLNAEGVPTARGGRWHASTVRNVVRGG